MDHIFTSYLHTHLLRVSESTKSLYLGPPEPCQFSLFFCATHLILHFTTYSDWWLKITVFYILVYPVTPFCSFVSDGGMNVPIMKLTTAINRITNRTNWACNTYAQKLLHIILQFYTVNKIHLPIPAIWQHPFTRWIQTCYFPPQSSSSTCSEHVQPPKTDQNFSYHIISYHIISGISSAPITKRT